MTGNAPDLRAFAAVARAHGALLYVDDAHGFGVIGERSPDEPCPYGSRGNSIVRHFGETLRQRRAGRRLLEGVLVAARLHRLPDGCQEPAEGRGAALPVLGALAGRLARHGAGRLRRQRAAAATSCARTCTATARACSTRWRALGVRTPNHSGLPIIEIPLARPRAHRRGRALSCSTAAST